jgi:uncharacterized protein YjbK
MNFYLTAIKALLLKYDKSPLKKNINYYFLEFEHHDHVTGEDSHSKFLSNHSLIN